MSAQFITHDEFDAGQDRLFMRLTAFLTTQNDLIKTQAREDKRELLERSQADKAEILTGIRNLSKQMSDLETSQTTLKAATEGHARDISKQLADSVASINESINKLVQRVSKLESK